MAFLLYSDGGARGNPGPAGIGAVIYSDSKEVIEELHDYIGEATNNVAEYKALIMGMKAVISRSNNAVLNCFLDSELIVKQLNGLYRVRSLGLKPLYDLVIQLKSHFSKITFTHVRREKNKEADRLVNYAIDQALNK